MPSRSYAELSDRGIIRITGDDSRDFLQGLISNDINQVGPARAIYAALLTPQGKYLFDFFIVEHDGGLLLETEATAIPALTKRLTMYKLRSQVTLEDVSANWRVLALWGDDTAATLSLAGEAGAAAASNNGVAFIDPRLAEVGARAYVSAGDTLGEFEAADNAAYDSHRLALGLPDGSRDLVAEKSILLESGFDELHGVDWNKGCYMGQELTARTKYRGLVKKRLVPIAIDGPLPEPGTPIMAGDKSVGEVRSGRDGQALALIRLETLEDTSAGLIAGDAKVTPRKPDWASF